MVLRAVGRIIELARAASLPLVIDADGLWLVAQNTSVVHGYSRCILTPNAAEFDRLMAAVGLSLSPRTPPASDDTVKSDYDHAKAKCDRDAAAVHALSLALGGVTVVKKGATDIISSGTGEGPPPTPTPTHPRRLIFTIHVYPVPSLTTLSPHPITHPFNRFSQSSHYPLSTHLLYSITPPSQSLPS